MQIKNILDLSIIVLSIPPCFSKLVITSADIVLNQKISVDKTINKEITVDIALNKGISFDKISNKEISVDEN